MSLFFTPPDFSLYMGLFPQPEVVRLTLGAPTFLQGLRLLFVSDVHLRPGVSNERLQALMELIASQEADLLLLGGDYAETPADCLRFFDFLGKLRFPLGTFAVAGNNDRDSAPTLAETMQRASTVLLKNDSRLLELPGGTLEIAGCDDHKYGHPATRDIFRSPKADYRILLSHYPSPPDCSCDLILSGHTHGGQANFLGVTPYSFGFEHRYRLMGVRGIRRRGPGHLLIGNGIGISRIPLRLGARAEIYLVKFGREDLF